MANDRDALPIADYDQLTVDALQHRIRSLDESGVQALLTYEQDHGDRVPVKQVLHARLDQLSGGATPTAGSDATPNDTAAGTPTDTPARISGDTAGAPAMNPPAHGDPTNPSQPRS